MWLGLAISALFIGIVLWQANPREILAALRSANYWWLAPAAGISLLGMWVRSIRYAHIVRSLHPASARSLFPVIAVGIMANNLLPLRMGELVRAYLLGERYRLSKMAGLGTAVSERLFDGLTLLALLAVTVAVLGASGAIHDITLIAVVVFAAALAVFVFCLASPDGAEALVARLSLLIPHRFRQRAVTLAVSFIEGLRSLRHADAIAWVVGTSFVAWLMETAVFWCVGQAFALDLPLGYFAMAVAAGNLALTAPSSPGGTGPFEFVVTQVLILAAVVDSTAAAYSFVVHLTVLIPGTIVGLICLWMMHLSLGRLSERAGEGAAMALAEPGEAAPAGTAATPVAGAGRTRTSTEY